MYIFEWVVYRANLRWQGKRIPSFFFCNFCCFLTIFEECQMKRKSCCFDISYFYKTLIVEHISPLDVAKNVNGIIAMFQTLLLCCQNFETCSKLLKVIKQISVSSQYSRLNVRRYYLLFETGKTYATRNVILSANP